MSKLMSALAQSESKQPQAAPTPQFKATSLYAKPAARRWGIPLLLAVAPVAGVLGYQVFVGGSEPLPSTEKEMVIATAPAEPVQAKVVVAPAVEKEAEAFESAVAVVYPEGITRLAYPELYTEPMPRFQQTANQTRYPSPRPIAGSPELQGAPGGQVGNGAGNTADIEDSWDLTQLDYSELSPQIAQQLRSAIEATGDGEPLPRLIQQEREQIVESPIEAIAFGELPASVQDRLPSMDFQAHIYSSMADSRWVKVNGREAYEGDEIAPGVRLRRIEPRQVVFDFESYLIAMPALSEW